MRTKGAKNRTPEEREALAAERVAAKTVRAQMRKQLPTPTQARVLNVIKAHSGIGVLELHTLLREHVRSTDYLRSILRDLRQKGLIHAVKSEITYRAS